MSTAVIAFRENRLLCRKQGHVSIRPPFRKHREAVVMRQPDSVIMRANLEAENAGPP
jgi:hypothetical protein